MVAILVDMTRALALRKRGKSNAEVAADQGVSVELIESRFSKLIKEGKLKALPRGQPCLIPDARLPEIMKLENSGMSRREIAKCIGIARSTVNQAVWRAQKLGIGAPAVALIVTVVEDDADDDIEEAPIPPPAPIVIWTEGRDRYLRVLKKEKTPPCYMVEELNSQYPHLPRVSLKDVCSRLYGGAR